MKTYTLTVQVLVFAIFSVVNSVELQAQLNNHWHFGVGASINFTNGAPELGSSSVNTGVTTQPSTLTDAFGNLLLYTDGSDVYNSDGIMVVNGSFSSTAFENIFAPFPGSENKHYLFRSGGGIISWSIIDLNDGIGSIQDDEKEVILLDYYAELMVTSHANMTDFWLICADNEDNGQQLIMKSFLISSAGLTLTSEYSDEYSLTGFDNVVDDARMSPSCVKFATLHKGHLATLFNFDNATGEITLGFADSADTGSSFSDEDYFEFSENGEYLYIILNSSTIARFDAVSFNFANFEASQENIDIDPGEYHHIKRGPDGHMYVINASNNSIDRIINTEDANPIYEANVLDLTDIQANYFPNTMNSCQSELFINAHSVCIGDTTAFLANVPSIVDSLYWVISGEGVQDTVYSVTSFSQYYDQPNILDITLHYLFVDIWYELETESIIFAQPSVNLPEDIVTCAGDTIQLSVGETPYNVQWSTSSSSPFIDVTTTGTYTATITNGLCSATDQIEIEFIQEPNINLQDVVVCDEQIDITLDATSQNVDDYEWMDGTTGPTLTVDETGIYSIIATNECFTANEDATVTYIFFPPSLIDSTFSLCGLDTLDLESIYQEGDIQWSSGDTGPFASIYEDGDYTININHLGCLTSDQFYVERLPYVDAEDLIFPNVITVNDDNMNDVFRGFDPRQPTDNICDYSTLTGSMSIFNRWGNEIHAGGCLWNGEIDNVGAEVSEGIYYYMVDISSKCKHLESEKEFVGFVHVLK